MLPPLAPPTLQFAMVAGLGMHFLDDVLASCVRPHSATPAATLHPADVEFTALKPARDGNSAPTEDFSAFQALARKDAPAAAHARKADVSDRLLSAIVHVHSGGGGGGCDSEHGAASSASEHAIHAQVVASALMLEFGVGVHSVLIGRGNTSLNPRAAPISL
jgi:hypothetical protein